MRAALIVLALVIVSTTASAKCVNGYYKKDGTYVSGYCKQDADQYKWNNNSSQTNGGSEKDEYSTPSSTNKSNPSWGYSDNDGDGVMNAYDSKPNNKGSY